MTEVDLVLYKAPAAWGLPSLSPACVQVEAYLRLGGVQFAVQECASSASPTGSVPALDTRLDLVGGEQTAAAPLAEFATARTLISFLKSKVVDLDRGLSASQRAEATAFCVLIEAKLHPAIAHTTWCEAEAFARHTRAAYGRSLPFPLSYWIPRSQRKAVLQHFAGASASEVYQGAAEALDALAQRLAGADFFFGAQPTSVDALLFSCLAYLRIAPVVHPQLRHKLEGHRVLGAYVERLSQLAFATSAPAAADVRLGEGAWSSSRGADDKYSKAKTEQENELQRKGRRWLLCAAAAIAAYAYLSGYVYLDLGGVEYVEEEEED